MGSFDDLPIIQCRPGPSDAELQADRDAKHRVAVAEFNAQEARRACAADIDHIPAWSVRG